MKTFKQAISLALSVLLVASALFIGATAETTATVNGTEIDFYNFYSTNNSTVGTPLLREQFEAAEDSKPLIPELPSDRYTFTWDAEANSTQSESLEKFFENEAMSNAAIYTLLETQAVSINTALENATNLIDVSSANGGLMFYISLGETSKETVLYIESQCVGFNEDGTIILASESKYKQYYGTTHTKDSPYYLLNAGTASWETKTITDKLGVGSKKDSYGITLPAGYEGFVYLPRDSFLYNRNLSIEEYKYFYRTDFYVNNLSSANTVEVSNIMIVDGDVTKAESIEVGGKSYNFEYDGFYSFDALNVSGVDVSYDEYYDFTNKDGQLALGYGADNSSFSVNMGADKNGGISPDSYYTATPADQTSINVRPTSNAQWQIFKTTKNGRLYTVDYNLPEPLKNTVRYPSYEADGVTPSYWKDIYESVFEFYEDGTSAYVGGIYRDIKIKNSDDATNTTTHPTQIYITSTPVDMTGKAAMVYFKHTYDANIAQQDKQPMKVCFQIVANDGGSYFLEPGQVIYAYDLSTKKWSSIVMPRTDDSMALGQMGKATAYVEVPVDFEGWFMLPGEAMLTSQTGKEPAPTTLKDFKVCPDAFGRQYGECVFGDVTVVDSFNPILVASGSVFVSSNEIALSADFPFATISEFAQSTPLGTIGTVAAPSGINKSASAGYVTFTATNNFDPRLTGTKLQYGEATSSALTRIEVWPDSSKSTQASIGNNKAVVFRVENTSETATVLLTGNQYAFMAKNKPYYLLDDASNEWTTAKTPETYIEITLNNHVYSGSTITIPAGFKGYVSMPFDSLSSSTYTTYYRFPFLPVSMEGSLTLGEFALYNVVTPVYDVNWNGMNSNIPNLVAYDPANTKNVTIAGGVLTNESDALYADFKVNGAVTTDEALMFYAKNDSEASVSFKIDGFNMVSARTYDKNFRDWAGYGPEATEVTLPAGFDGWVRVSVSEDYEFTALRFIFSSLADGFAVSDFMVANRAGNCDYMRRGTTYKTPLFYMTGDFNEDGNVDVLDLVYNKKNPEVKFDVMKFEGDQQTALRTAILAR